MVSFSLEAHSGTSQNFSIVNDLVQAVDLLLLNGKYQHASPSMHLDGIAR